MLNGGQRLLEHWVWRRQLPPFSPHRSNSSKGIENWVALLRWGNFLPCLVPSFPTPKPDALNKVLFINRLKKNYCKIRPRSCHFSTENPFGKAALRACKDSLQARNDSLQARNDALQARKDTLRACKDSLQARNDSLQAHKAALTSRFLAIN